MNRQIFDDVASDLITHEFFGLDPQNVMIVENDLDYGFIIQDGQFRKSPKKEHLTNYNHGFNIIKANIPGFSYRYDPETKRFEALTNMTGLQYLRAQGAETAVIHRMNDLILIVSDTAVDIQMLALWQKAHTELGANCLNEVLNNPGGQKGGLAFSTGSYGQYSFLIEGLAVKSMLVNTKMAQMNEQVKEDKKSGLQGIPYNRLYKAFDIQALETALANNNGVLPMSIKHKNGALSPEIPTGDMTGLSGMNTMMCLRRNDTLIDEGILPESDNYRKDLRNRRPNT